jgi:predicted HTH transcriptional regulator
MITPKKNDDFVKGLLKMGEGENLEFKVAISNAEKFAKTLAAFGNTSGGTVLIGINDQKKIIGVDVEEELHMVEVAGANFLSSPPPLSYEVYEISPDFGENDETVNLLLVKIEKSDDKCYFRPAEPNPVLYQRSGARNVQTSISSDPDSPPK